MYEPMAVLRSLAELQHKFQPDPCSNSIDFASPTSAAANYEEALSKAMEDGDYKNTPAFLAEENQVKVIEYKGENVASFIISNIEMICLPQVYELFLKNMVGGLHTVYTKLKRLEISPLVCNVEQVRALRSLGAIQPGVNRCKLIAKTDFDLLYDDCTSSCNRPGRPAKRVTDDWLTAQQSLTVTKQSKVEVGSPPIVVSQSGPFSAESLLNSTAPSNILGSSLLSGMNSLNGSQSALLSLLPGFNHILMQQVIAQQAKLRETRERECENEDDDRRDDGDQSREEEEKDESNSCTDDSPMSNKKREQKSQLSPNNNSGSSPSGRFSQNQMNSQDFSKLISLLESTVENFKKREDVSEEKDRRERAERQLAIERKRSNLYIIRWNRTRREMASLRERIKVLEESSKDV
ncbi:dac-1 [Pristionchus pacificus]|nr:dac-1 [Pristionchus pacificus]